MIELILDLDILSQELTAAIHSRTEGNPFFVEELLKALVELGDLFSPRAPGIERRLRN